MTPPHSVEAEQAVIGAVMLDATVFDAVSADINARDFYRADHQLIWSAISACRTATPPQPVDVVTLSDYLANRQQLDDAGGLAYLGTLANDTPSAANAAAYAAIVRDKSLRRQLISAANESLRAAASDGERSAKQIIEGFEQEIFRIGQAATGARKTLRPVREVMRAVVEEMDDLFNNPPADGVSGASTGFADLDARLSGLSGGELVIVAGRPSMGKSTLALNMAEAVAQNGGAVVVYSLEMSASQIGQKLLASQGRVPLGRVRAPWNMRDEDWPGVGTGVTKVSGMPIWIDETMGATVHDIVSRSRRAQRDIQREHGSGIALVVVDYIQLLQTSATTRANTRADEVAEFSRALKMLAKELDCPVVALSQLNRKLEQRPNKRPNMSDLRESGALEQDADVILFVYRDEIYNDDSPDAGIAEIITGKQRMGEIGTDRLAFRGEYSRFENLVTGGYQ